jgi:cytochrome c peroxidase
MLAVPAIAALPPPPVPKENPITEDKRVLGKALFWDEQLSSDNTVACGTCHRPGAGGGDPRRARGPGHDGKLGTADDIFGSPGVRAYDERGRALHDVTFGDGIKVGTRASPSYFSGIWDTHSFWDGRAGPVFRDPLSGRIEIADGGALENQAIGPLLNDAEMARTGRTWPQILNALRQAKPLALARNIPADLKPAAVARDYPQLFQKAFGTPDITPTRIAFAIASYERTLVADQTPWDLDASGVKPFDSDLAAAQTWFDYMNCSACHKPPLFADDRFYNIGVRPAFQDFGRGEVSRDKKDEGRMKTPSLRNISLRSSFTHTGELTTLDQVLDLYASPNAPRDTLPDGTDYSPRAFELGREAVKLFITKALVDPRVASESFPFDRPQLRSERAGKDTSPAPAAPTRLQLQGDRDGVILTWDIPAGVVEDYVVTRNGEVVGLPTQPQFLDTTAGLARLFVYRVAARNTAAKASSPASAIAFTAFVWIWPLVALMLAGCVALALKHRVRRKCCMDHSSAQAATSLEHEAVTETFLCAQEARCDRRDRSNAFR